MTRETPNTIPNYGRGRSGPLAVSRLALLTLSTAALALNGAGPVRAQNEDRASDKGGLEEIVVTARKREESLQETPVAITALTGEMMEARNMTNLVELGAFVPNVSMNLSASSAGSGSLAQIYIRGVGQSDFLFTTDPGVGVYIDGVYNPRNVGRAMDLLDIERVEVLRGPQGTLFGRNTIGGAVSLTSKKPSGETGGEVQITTGRYDRLEARGNFEFPLSDTLAAKFSFSSKNRDPLGKRLDFETGDVIDHTGDENTAGARAAFTWQASEAVSVDLIADYSRERENGIPNVLLNVDEAGAYGGLMPLWNALVGAPNGQTYGSEFIIGNRYDSYATGPNRNTLDAYGVAATINWEAGPNISIKSITAYREMDVAFSSDSDASPLQYAETDQDQDQNQFSQEIQINGTGMGGRLNWVAGAIYFDEFGRDVNTVRLASGLWDALEALPGAIIPLSPAPCPTACLGGAGNPLNALFDLDLDVYNEIDIKSYGFFTQGSFDVTDRLSLTAGVRYTYDKKDYTLDHWRHNAGVPTISLRTVSDNWDSVTPMASIDYRINDQILTYASVSRGYKSGGFNGRPIQEGQVDSFDPEKVTAYEVGVKSDLFQNRMRLNLAAFYSDYTDVQMGSISADSTGNLVLRIQNAGKAEIKGFEVELQARPAPGFDIVGSLGYTDFQITKLDPGVVELTLDSKQVKTPEWNGAVGLQYSWNIGDSASFTVRGDWTFQSSTFQDVQNSGEIRVPKYDVGNARVTYENLDRNWQIALFVTNFTDKKYITNAFQTFGSFQFATGQYGRPREWGLNLKKTF